jgi:hypothetical protein
VTPGHALSRGRLLAEQAAPLKLKRLTGALLVLGRVSDSEIFVARAFNASAPVPSSDLGLVIVRASRLHDALAMALGGWVVARVASGSRLVGPTYADYRRARQRLKDLGIDWRMPLYEVAAAS